MKIDRRLDQTSCPYQDDCPAVFVLDNGDLAVVGVLADDELTASLPEGSGIGKNERLVTVPRAVAESAGWQVPVPNQ